VGTGYDWAVIEWTTNLAGNGISTVYAGTDGNRLQKADQTAEPVEMSRFSSYEEQQYTHLVRLQHLEPGTTYYFLVDSETRDDLATSHISQLTTTRHFGSTNPGTTISDYR